MTLSARILSAVVLLGLLLAGVLGADFLPAWHQARQAQAHQSLNSASSALVEAAGAMAVERGLANGFLAAPASASAELQEKISNSRAKASESLARGLALAPGGASTQLTDTLARLDSLRRDISLGAGATTTPAVWFSSATAAIDAVVALRRRIDVDAGTEPVATQMIALRDHLAEMSEFAGRLRGYVNGLISRGGRGSAVEALAIGILTGRINGGWTAIEARLDSYPDEIRPDVVAAGRAWNNEFGPVQNAVTQAAAEGRDWPVSAQDWFRQATQAIDVLLATQKHSGTIVATGLEAERTQGDHAVMIGGLGLATAIAVILGAIWYVRRRVVAPLRQVIGVINRLAADDLDAEPPAVTSSDEIGQLCAATVRFRITAREAKVMGEQQTALAAQAARARTEAIQEIGTMIEDVSEQAINTVKARTGEVVALSHQVHAIATVISGDIQGAVGDFGACAGKFPGGGRRRSGA